MINPYTAPASIVATNQALVDVTAGQTIPLDQNVTISSADASVTGATVSIGTGFVSGADTLSFANQSGISGSYSASTGVLTLTGSATPAQYQTALQSITFSSTNASIATRAVSYVVNDASDPGTSSSNTASLNIVVSPPITITGAWVKNPTWGASGTENFFGYLASHGLGSATLGYALQTGASQTTDIPWANITTISVSFSGPVNDIGVGSLKLVGGTGGGGVAAPNGGTATGFTSDGNNTYSWTFPTALGNNKYVFAIATTGSSFGTASSTQVVDNNGAGVSGTFATGQAFPSGNGLADSTFDFRFSVLPNDGKQQAQVNASDESQVKALLNDHETNANYNPYYDYNGAGIVTAGEASQTAAALNTKQSGITQPTSPSIVQVGSAGNPLGTTGFTALELGVQESNSSPASGSPTTALSNVTSAANVSPSTTPVATTSVSSASAGSATTVAASTAAQNQATDEAVSDFDLAEVLV